jgi:hypothetical protein
VASVVLGYLFVEVHSIHGSEADIVKFPARAETSMSSLLWKSSNTIGWKVYAYSGFGMVIFVVVCPLGTSTSTVVASTILGYELVPIGATAAASQYGILKVLNAVYILFFASPTGNSEIA